MIAHAHTQDDNLVQRMTYLSIASELHGWTSLPWNVWLDYTDKLVKDLAVAVAGIWAYLKFIKGRVYHTRLEPSVDGKVFQHDGHSYISVVARLKNLGASKVDLRQQGTAVEIGCADLHPESFDPHKSVQWTRIKTAPVFKNHGWIEASETIAEGLLFRLPTDTTAINVELRLMADRHQWFPKLTQLKQGWRKPPHDRDDRDRNRNQWYTNAIIDTPNGRTEDNGGKEPNVAQKQDAKSPATRHDEENRRETARMDLDKLERTTDEGSATKQDKEDRRETERIERDKLEDQREDERTSERKSEE